jgi:hypothetical protein
LEQAKAKHQEQRENISSYFAGEGADDWSFYIQPLYRFRQEENPDPFEQRGMYNYICAFIEDSMDTVLNLINNGYDLIERSHGDLALVGMVSAGSSKEAIDGGSFDRTKSHNWGHLSEEDVQPLPLLTFNKSGRQLLLQLTEASASI